MDLFDIAVASKLAGGGGGGGGGSSNIVTGTFKSTETGVFALPTSYTGNGYPINIFIEVKGGVDCPDTDFYDLISSGALALYAGAKSNPAAVPTYSEIDIKNQLDYVYIKKNSTSSAHSFNAQTSSHNTLYKATIDPSTSNPVVIKSNTDIKLYISDSGTVFRRNIEYSYLIIYSS